jgi:hypothetical protein
MHHVGRDDQVKGVRRKPLRDRVGLDVERPILDERIVGELLPGAREEEGGNIGEDILRSVRGQNLENL